MKFLLVLAFTTILASTFASAPRKNPQQVNKSLEPLPKIAPPLVRNLDYCVYTIHGQNITVTNGSYYALLLSGENSYRFAR